MASKFIIVWLSSPRAKTLAGASKSCPFAFKIRKIRNDKEGNICLDLD